MSDGPVFDERAPFEAWAIDGRFMNGMEREFAWDAWKERARRGAPAPVAQEPQRVRYTSLPAILPVAEYDRIQAHPLYQLGDCIQVWVNEGDILRAGQRIEPYATQPASSPPVAPQPEPDALVERLRDYSSKTCCSDRIEAADALEALQRECADYFDLIRRQGAAILRVCDAVAPGISIHDVPNKIEALQQRVRGLERRLEIPQEPFAHLDGIECRDETIKQQDAVITRLESQRASAEAELAQARKVIAAADVLIRKWDEQNYSLAGCDDLVTTLSGELALYYRAARAQVGQGEGKK